MGKPVVDIAVFTGEEIPRRSVLPDRLVNTLPGIFGAEKIAAEKKRLQNEGQPQRQIPDGVTHSANMADPENYIDPLNGYAYDSFNPDALMMMSVKDGSVVLPGGASYKILIIPGNMKLNPANSISNNSIQKIIALVKEGATVMIDSLYIKAISSIGISTNFIDGMANFGKGKLVLAPYWKADFAALGLEKDFTTTPLAATSELPNLLPKKLAMQHRRDGDKEIYFIANQNDQTQTFNFYFKSKGLLPEIYDPVTGTIEKPYSPDIVNGKIDFFETFEPYQSKFIIFEKKGIPVPHNQEADMHLVKRLQAVQNDWQLNFNINDNNITRTVKAYELQSWATDSLEQIKYFSGTVVYKNSFTMDKNPDSLLTAVIRIGQPYNMATVKINGMDCGTIWTKPFEANILKALHKGENKIEIEVTNTWHNRLIGDSYLPVDKRSSFTTAPYRLTGKPLEPAGIVGAVEIQISFNR
jgi:hypothetical protein